MNMMTQFNHNQNSITSLDISELVQSELRAVNLSIERLAKRGVIQLPPMVKVENKQSTCPWRANCSQTGSLQTALAHVAVDKISRLQKAIDLAMTRTTSLMAPLSPIKRVQLS